MGLWYGSSGELQKAVIGNRWGVHDNFNAWDFEFDSSGNVHVSSNLIDLRFGTEGRPTPNLGNPMEQCFWESRTRSVAGDFPTGNQAGPIGESKRDCMEALLGNLGFPLAASAQGECGNMGNSTLLPWEFGSSPLARVGLRWESRGRLRSRLGILVRVRYRKKNTHGRWRGRRTRE